MSITITLEQDEALVLFDLLQSSILSANVKAPERNALNALESLLEKKLTAPLSSEYSKQLNAARQSLLER